MMRQLNQNVDIVNNGVEVVRATKREITFVTEMYGAKTFLIYVEPDFRKNGEKLCVNYITPRNL